MDTQALATQDFQEERLSCLGGTDIAALLGLNPYRTPMDVWLEKTGQGTPFEGNERTEMGTGLEPYIAAKYEKQTGHRVVKGRFLRHPDYPFFGGHIDYEVPEGPHLVECKLVGSRATKRWSEPGPDQRVPEEYYCQVQWYLLLTGYQAADLVAQKEFKRKLDIYVIQRDDDFLAKAMEAGIAFWTQNVEERIAPALTGTKTDGQWLAKTFAQPGDSAGIVQASAVERNLLREYQAVEEEYEALKKEYEALRNRIKGAIGENLGVQGPGFKATWVPVKDTTSKVVDWRKFLQDRFAYVPSDGDLAGYTSEVVVRAGGRRLDIKWGK